MTDKEFAEIKRRFKPDKGNITNVRGCYVSSTKEILSKFKIPVTVLPDEQKEWLFKLLKKSISGSMGRNLMNIEFDRSKRYYLILRNIAKPDEYIEREQFTIDILQFKMF